MSSTPLPPPPPLTLDPPMGIVVGANKSAWVLSEVNCRKGIWESGQKKTSVKLLPDGKGILASFIFMCGITSPSLGILKPLRIHSSLMCMVRRIWNQSSRRIGSIVQFSIWEKIIEDYLAFFYSVCIPFFRYFTEFCIWYNQTQINHTTTVTIKWTMIDNERLVINSCVHCISRQFLMFTRSWTLCV